MTSIAITGALYLTGRARRVLIVAPLSIVGVWREEFAKFADYSYTLAVLGGTAQAKRKALENLSGDGLQVAVINYESAWRMEKELLAWDADLILCDEGHKIKTHNIAASKAMHRLGARARYRLLLTGTLITNKAIDVFSPYKFLNPAIYGNSFYTFRNRYFDMQGYGNYTPVLKKHMEAELTEKLHSIAFRARKADCLDLPEVTEIVRRVPLESAAAKIYKAMVEESFAALGHGEVTATNVLTRLLRLSQITGGFLKGDDGTSFTISTAKLDTLSDIVDSAMESAGIICLSFPADKSIMTHGEQRITLCLIIIVVCRKKRGCVKLNSDRRKKILIFAAIILVIVIGIGAFFLIMSYKMSLIPSMTFEEMLAYTTKGEEKAIVTVGIIKNGVMSFIVYGKDAMPLPNFEYEYEIGSVTKTFTASLLCKAIYDRKVMLDDSIDQYLALPTKDYYPTLKRLATHTSGYKGYYFDWQMAFNFLHGEKNDFYSIDHKTLIRKAGEIVLENKDYAFNYSNFGMSIIGSVLSQVFGNDYTAVMNDFIVSELKLEQTRISYGTGNLNRYWNWKTDDAYIPAGGIISTISDMMKYTELHMKDTLPYLSIGHVISAEVHATTKQNEQMGIRMDAMGLGWVIDTENSIIWHNGGTSDFNSYVAFDKEKQIGVVILSNLPPSYRIPATVMGVKLITALQNEHHH